VTSSSVISAALILGTTVVDGMVVRLAAPLQAKVSTEVRLVNNQRCSTSRLLKNARLGVERDVSGVLVSTTAPEATW